MLYSADDDGELGETREQRRKRIWSDAPRQWKERLAADKEQHSKKATAQNTTANNAKKSERIALRAKDKDVAQASGAVKKIQSKLVQALCSANFWCQSLLYKAPVAQGPTTLLPRLAAAHAILVYNITQVLSLALMFLVASILITPCRLHPFKSSHQGSRLQISIAKSRLRLR